MTAEVKRIREFLSELGGCLEKNSLFRDVSCLIPRELHLELTYKCNSRCVMCNLGSLRENQETHDLTLGDVTALVEDSEFLQGIEYVILSGGEPWYNEDMRDIAVFVLNRFPSARVLILSNLTDSGLILPRLKEIESRAGLERVSIGSSIDGIGSAHDAIRGAGEAFNSAVATAFILKKKYPGLFISFNFTLLPGNAGGIYDVYKWSGRTGFSVSYQAAVPKKETEKFLWSEADLMKAGADVDRIIADTWEKRGWDVFEPKQLFDDLTLLFKLLNFHYMLRFIGKPERYFGNCPCGERYAMLNPEGGLYFCPVNKDMSPGNIRKERFDELWSGPRAQEIRSFFNRRSCSCWLSCTNSVMMAENFFRLKDMLESRFL